MKPRQTYMGYYPVDQIIERARRMAEKDGRLRYVANGCISLRSFKGCDFVCMGAIDWSTITNGSWTKKQYLTSSI